VVNIWHEKHAHVPATALGLSQTGLAHGEEYPDAGRVEGRIVGLGEPLPEGV
jgi:hypothetical protein